MGQLRYFFFFRFPARPDYTTFQFLRHSFKKKVKAIEAAVPKPPDVDGALLCPLPSQRVTMFFSP